MKRFSTILTVIFYGYKINFEEFVNCIKETIELYTKLCNWYSIPPPRVHTFLISGFKIIKNVLVPIGPLLEEAQEASNKQYIRFREYHLRKSLIQTLIFFNFNKITVI